MRNDEAAGRARRRLLPEHVREWLRPRAAAIVLTLLIEGVVVWLLLTMSPRFVKMADTAMSVFNVGEEPAPAANEPEAPAPAEESEMPPAEPERATEPPRPQPPSALAPPPEAQPAPSTLPFIPMTRDQMAQTDVRALPTQPSPNPGATRSMMGPSDPGVAGDSKRVGTAPGGQPLYAASWYREPTPGELSGYLSTASGPGWGLIACRTVADYRVEDCVALDEWPNGAQINRAVLAAAWQFRVRPPRVGGRSMVGEWVRIRIDVNMKRRERGG